MPPGFNPGGGGPPQWFSSDVLEKGEDGLPGYDPNQWAGQAYDQPGAPGAEGKAPGGKAAPAPSGMGRMGAILDAAVNYLAQVIRGGADSARSALAGLAQSLASTLLPAPFGGWVGTLLGAFIGQEKAVKVIPADGSMPMHFSTRADYGWDVNPASALLSGRGVYTSPAQPSVELVMNYQEGVEDVIAVKAATSAQRSTMRPTRRLSYGY